MTGRFIAVVGPSGVGKDSIMQGLAQMDKRFVLVRRVITRPSDAGGEDFEGVSQKEFTKREKAGEFALHWPAHGLTYGIPATVHDDLEKGRYMLANISRKKLHDARRAFPGALTLSLVAPKDMLAERLAKRGRETQAEIQARLDRQLEPVDGPNVVTINNNRSIDEAVKDAQSAVLSMIEEIGQGVE